MDELFDKLKSEAPKTENISHSGKLPSEDAGPTIQKTHTYSDENKDEPVDKNKTPQKVPTKGEKKYLENSIEQKFIIKNFQVQLKKCNFVEYAPKSIEKVSTKAEKKLFNEDETPVSNRSRSTSVRNKSTSNDEINKQQSSETTYSKSVIRVDQNRKRSVNAAKESTDIAKKSKLDEEVKLDKRRNERKRKSEAAASESKKKSHIVIAKKVSEFKNCIVRLKRIDLKNFGSLKNTRQLNERLKKETKTRKLNATYQNAPKDKRISTEVTAKKRGRKPNSSIVNGETSNHISNKKKMGKSRSPSKAASPEFKIKLPIITKKIESKRTSIRVERDTRKTTTPKNRLSITEKRTSTKKYNTLSEENLINLYGKRMFSLRVRIQQCKMNVEGPIPVNISCEVPQVFKNKKRMNVSFVEKVELIGDGDVQKLSPAFQEKNEEYILPEDMSVENMERLIVSPPTTPNTTTENIVTSPDTNLKNSENEQTDTPIQNEPIQKELQESSITENIEMSEDVNQTLDKEDTVTENEVVNGGKEIQTDKEDIKSQKADNSQEVLNVSVENQETEEEVLNKDLEKDEETNEDAELKNAEEGNIFDDAERDVITLMPEDDCSDTIHAQNESLINKICNNGHSHDLDLTSEHSNDGVIKNDVMMNGLDISNEINKPILKNSLDKTQTLELITSEDEFGVDAYSPASFRSAHSDIETHADKGSDTKLSDISDASVHAEMDFSAPEIAATVEVSQVEDEPMFTNAAGLGDADDVSQLLAGMEDIPTKSPLEVEKLNASISLIDDTNATQSGLTEDVSV